MSDLENQTPLENNDTQSPNAESITAEDAINQWNLNSIKSTFLFFNPFWKILRAF